MVISLCKVQTDVKPNIYASLDIIPEIGTNGSKPRSNRAQNGLLHHQISSKRSKMVINGQKLQKVGKIFQKISINSKKFKNSISFEIFTHLSSKIPTQIPGASSSEIRHRLIQVTPYVLLFLFDVNFLSFHGPFNFLGHPKLCVSAHMSIGVFFHVWQALYVEKTLIPAWAKTHNLGWPRKLNGP